MKKIFLIVFTLLLLSSLNAADQKSKWSVQVQGGINFTDFLDIQTPLINSEPILFTSVKILLEEDLLRWGGSFDYNSVLFTETIVASGHLGRVLPVTKHIYFVPTASIGLGVMNHYGKTGFVESLFCVQAKAQFQASLRFNWFEISLVPTIGAIFSPGNALSLELSPEIGMAVWF